MANDIKVIEIGQQTIILNNHISCIVFINKVILCNMNTQNEN